MSRFGLPIVVVLAQAAFCTAVDEAFVRRAKVNVELAPAKHELLEANVFVRHEKQHHPAVANGMSNAVAVQPTGMLETVATLQATADSNNAGAHWSRTADKMAGAEGLDAKTLDMNDVSTWQRRSAADAIATRARPRDAFGLHRVDARTLSNGTRILHNFEDIFHVKKYSRDVPRNKEENELIIPGKMASAPLYILDVIALPKDNSIAVLVLGKRSFTALTNATLRANLLNMNQTVEEELVKLPMALDVEVEHQFSCGVVDTRIHDSQTGGSEVLLCRANGSVDLAKELQRTKHASSDLLKIRLGSETVRLSARRLSTATHGTDVTRNYFSDRKSTEPFQASAVIPLYGKTPYYLAETMAYLNLSGIAHVYIGLFHSETLDETRRQLEPFMRNGFVSVLSTDEWPDIHFSTGRHGAPYFTPVELWKTLINDWALYHAKGLGDDLLLIHDYDEFMVPTIDSTVPRTVHRLLQKLRSETTSVSSLDDICFFNFCPMITLGNVTRMNRSRAEDFPFMEASQTFRQQLTDGSEGEGFMMGYPSPDDSDDPPDRFRDFCSKGGHSVFYPKSIAVVKTTYKTSLHLPGSCSVMHRDPYTGQAIGPHMNVAREEGLFVQHFIAQHEAAKTREGPIESAVPSTFTKVWGPRLDLLRGTDTA